MTHLGDVTKIDGGKIPPVEVITAGSPCQDLSVAGNGAGLAGERSGLFYQIPRIVREMREATDGKYPTYVVFENVPGALSSNKGADWHIILQEFAAAACPGADVPRPAGGKFRAAGAVVGHGWSIAWRVFDAQFWGVPQRRRRVALVLSIGGKPAPEILFEREGLPGDIAPGGEAGQAPAADAGAGAGGAGKRLSTLPLNLQIVTRHNKLGRGTGMGVGKDGDPAYTLQAGHEHGVAQTVFCLQGNTVDRQSGQNGRGVNEDVAFTLDAADRHAVAFMAGQGASSHGIGAGAEVAPTLETAPSGLNQAPSVCCPKAGVDANRTTAGGNNTTSTLCATYGTKWNGNAGAFNGDNFVAEPAPSVCYPEVAPTLTARSDGSPTPKQMQNVVVSEVCDALCMATVQANAEINTELCPTLNCDHEQPIVAGHYIVRRLTPLECERLQGYPDYWTLIPETRQQTPQGKWRLVRASDAARYKAIGNSIALPVWAYVLGKVRAALGRDGTLGSLFDGIGGFPLVWERLGGRAVWASEIEPFCVAVTEYRFGDKRREV